VKFQEDVMARTLTVAVVTALFVAAGASSLVRAQQAAPDVILTNGKIITSMSGSRSRRPSRSRETVLSPSARTRTSRAWPGWPRGEST
jgi:hypothetical protein